MTTLREGLERALTGAFGVALAAMSAAAPAASAGGVIGLLTLRPWQPGFRDRRGRVVVLACVAGAGVGALVGGTAFGPEGPKLYSSLAWQLVGALVEGAFVGGVLVAGGLLEIRRAVMAWVPSPPRRKPGRGALHLIVALLGWATLLRGRAADAIYVDQAALVHPMLYYDPPSDTSLADQEITQFPLLGHRMVRGSGTVIAFRWYAPGTIAIDDEAFEKLTLYVRGGFSGNGQAFALTDTAAIRAAYTRGGAAWPQLACAGYATGGTVHLSRWPLGRIRVRLEAEIRAVTPRAYCAGPLRRTFIAAPRPLATLGPWLGGCAGEHVYRETYRNRGECRPAPVTP